MIRETVLLLPICFFGFSTLSCQQLRTDTISVRRFPDNPRLSNDSPAFSLLSPANDEDGAARRSPTVAGWGQWTGPAAVINNNPTAAILMTLTDFYVVLGRPGRRPTRSPLIDQLREYICARETDEPWRRSCGLAPRRFDLLVRAPSSGHVCIIPEFHTKVVVKSLLYLQYLRGIVTSLPLNRPDGSIGRALDSGMYARDNKRSLMTERLRFRN